MKNTPRKRTIIVGLSRLGSAIAAKTSEQGEDVIVIDKDDDSLRKLSNTYSGYQLIADVVDIDSLEKAGIEKAKTVIVTTDDDNINIMIAEISSMIYCVPHVFVRLQDNDKSILLDSTNIHAIYPFLLSLAEFDNILKKEGEVR
ncbi:MAG: NAD-binding protein [bacterium]